MIHWMQTSALWSAGARLTDLFDWNAVGAIGTFLGLWLVARAAGRSERLARRKLSWKAGDLSAATGEAQRVLHELRKGARWDGDRDARLDRCWRTVANLSLDDAVALGVEFEVHVAKETIEALRRAGQQGPVDDEQAVLFDHSLAWAGRVFFDRQTRLRGLPSLREMLSPNFWLVGRAPLR